MKPVNEATSTRRLYGMRGVAHGVVLLAALMISEPSCAVNGTQPGGRLKASFKTNPIATTSETVMFSFHREELGAGRISVQLGPEGPRYVGSYLRLTGNRPYSSLRVYHTYWVSDAFDGFPTGPGGSVFNRRQITIEQFQQRYSGQVVAKLTGEKGGGMRCLFELLDPKGGLADGATGRCQMSDGGVVDLVQPVRN